jgi:hypothetical protein
VSHVKWLGKHTLDSVDNRPTHIHEEAAMARELKLIDVGDEPDLLRIAQEVKNTGEARLLMSGGEELALITPVAPAKPSRPKRGPLTADDPLFDLIGTGRSGVPGGVSGKKHEHLARPYRPR